MAMNKKVFAAMFVACLMIASFGAIWAEQSSEASGTHYTEIDELLTFDDNLGELSAYKINQAVGNEVCNYDVANNTLTFTASCNLRGVSATDSFLMVLKAPGETCSIMVNEGVTVNLAGGLNYNGEDGRSCGVIGTNANLVIGGEGKLNILVEAPADIYATGIWVDSYWHPGDKTVRISISEMEIVAKGHSCVAYFNPSVAGKITTVIANSHVTMEGKYVFVGYPTEINSISVNIAKSWVKFSGTEKVFSGKIADIAHPEIKLYASMSYRATDLKDFDDAKIMEYQFITSDYTHTSDLVIPLIVIFVIICIGLIFFVFFYVQRQPWEQEKYEAEKAKKKAAYEAKKAEMEKKKAAEAKKKEAAKRAAEEKKAAERAAAEKRRAAEAKEKEDARKAAEKKKAADKKAAEERKAAEAKEKEEARKAAEKKKAADKKAAEEKKAAEAKQKADAKKAAEAKKAKEAKQKADAKKTSKKK